MRVIIEIDTDNDAFRCTCEEVAYQNEGGICRHLACEGRQGECGEIISGTPTSPGECLGPKAPEAEVSRILRQLADGIGRTVDLAVGESHSLRDINGNRVGQMEVK